MLRRPPSGSGVVPLPPGPGAAGGNRGADSGGSPAAPTCSARRVLTHTDRPHRQTSRDVPRTLKGRWSIMLHRPAVRLWPSCRTARNLCFWGMFCRGPAGRSLPRQPLRKRRRRSRDETGDPAKGHAGIRRIGFGSTERAARPARCPRRACSPDRRRARSSARWQRPRVRRSTLPVHPAQAGRCQGRVPRP